jgi:predicted transcriptional regulator
MESSRETTELAHRRQKVAEMYLRGDYQSAIAQALGIDQAQVSRDLKAVRAMWLASTVRDFDAARAQELAKIDEVEREYWGAWERSKQDKEVAVQESDGKKDPDTGRPKIKKATLRKEGQSGNPAFLAGILTCIERRCAILGLDAPKRFVINWDELTPEQEEQLARGVPPEKVLKQAVTA